MISLLFFWTHFTLESIRIQFGNNNWDLETCRKRKKMAHNFMLIFFSFADFVKNNAAAVSRKNSTTSRKSSTSSGGAKANSAAAAAAAANSAQIVNGGE